MLYLTIIGGVFIAWLILATLFMPHIPYHIESAIDAGSDHCVHVLESTCQTHLEHDNRVEILTNGDRFYPAMLDAIRVEHVSLRGRVESGRRDLCGVARCEHRNHDAAR